MDRKEIQAQKLKRVGLRQAEGRSDIAVLELTTAKGSQFFTLDQTKIADFAEMLQKAASGPRLN